MADVVSATTYCVVASGVVDPTVTPTPVSAFPATTWNEFDDTVGTSLVVATWTVLPVPAARW